MRRSITVLTIAAAAVWGSLVIRWFRWPPMQPRAAERAADFKIDLNTASSAELRLLPGVGPVMAKHIADLRTAHGGRFDRPENLLAVERLGHSEYAKIRGRVVCGPVPATRPTE